jgi:hypothetical protein
MVPYLKMKKLRMPQIIEINCPRKSTKVLQDRRENQVQRGLLDPQGLLDPRGQEELLEE